MRRVTAILAAVALLFAVHLSQPPVVAAWSHSCAGPASYDPFGYAINSFSGVLSGSPGLTGARAKIEWSTSVDPRLCTGSGDGFSSSWVALTGDGGWDIYQVGIDKCKNGLCNADNGVEDRSYYFWAYGREAGSCGAALGPEPILAPLGLTSANSYWYQVYKSGSYYYARIGGSTQNSKTAGSLETCWSGGPQGAQYMTELWDLFDQNPGRVADQQFISSATWTDSGGTLTSVWRPYSTDCDVVDLSSMRCRIASNLHNSWYVWDTRQP